VLTFNSVFFQYYSSLPPGVQRKAVAQLNCYSPLEAREVTTTAKRKQQQKVEQNTSQEHLNESSIHTDNKWWKRR